MTKFTGLKRLANAKIEALAVEILEDSGGYDVGVCVNRRVGKVHGGVGSNRHTF